MKKFYFNFLSVLFFVSHAFSMYNGDSKYDEDSNDLCSSTNLPTKMYPYEILQENKKELLISVFNQLIKAIRAGNLDELKSLLEKNNGLTAADLNTFALDENGNTFIFYLFCEYVKTENEQGDQWGYSWLGHVGKDKIKAVKKCVELLKTKCGLNLKKTNKDTWNVMHAAAACGALDFMEIFLDLEPQLLETKHARGKTPLLIAANTGRGESINFLLSKNADFKTIDSRGWNIMHVIAMANKMDCLTVLCQFLIKQNKKQIFKELLEQKDAKGNCPLQYAESFLVTTSKLYLEDKH
jgi:hypothetical protein